jgi:hypothetical protein
LAGRTAAVSGGDAGLARWVETAPPVVSGREEEGIEETGGRIEETADCVAFRSLIGEFWSSDLRFVNGTDLPRRDPRQTTHTLTLISSSIDPLSINGLKILKLHDGLFKLRVENEYDIVLYWQVVYFCRSNF